MRRALLAGAALLLAIPADAQIIGGGVTAGPPATGITYTGLGTIRSGATHYYGVRCYSAAQASLAKAVHVVRLSDTTAMDIGLTASCKLDLPTASTFCNATTCTIDTWYDQIGTADLLQPVSSGSNPRPALIVTGNGGVSCNGIHSNMQATLAAVSTPLSFISVIKPAGGANGLVFGHLQNTAWEGHYMQWGPSNSIIAETAQAGTFAGSTTTATLSTGTVGTIAAIFPSTTSRTAWLNGTAATTDTTSKNPTNQNILAMCSDWSGNPNSNNFNGNVYEIAYYPADVTSSMAAMSANQTAYGF